jgi:hypothetical protein
LQSCPQAVKIQAKLAVLETLPELFFFGYALLAEFRYFFGAISWHYDNAVIIRHNHVAELMLMTIHL